MEGCVCNIYTAELASLFLKPAPGIVPHPSIVLGHCLYLIPLCLHHRLSLETWFPPYQLVLKTEDMNLGGIRSLLRTGPGCYSRSLSASLFTHIALSPTQNLRTSYLTIENQKNLLLRTRLTSMTRTSRETWALRVDFQYLRCVVLVIQCYNFMT